VQVSRAQFEGLRNKGVRNRWKQRKSEKSPGVIGKNQNNTLKIAQTGSTLNCGTVRHISIDDLNFITLSQLEVRKIASFLCKWGGRKRP
jgi:hypothetical protein